MLSTRIILSFMLVLVLSAFNGQNDKPQVSKWLILKGGLLRVDGSTNVNKFNCIITSYAQPDTLLLYKNSSKEGLQLNGSLVLDVGNFDCHIPVMTNDLRKTLKAKQFPKLAIRFLNLNRYPDFNARQTLIKGAVLIELAGVSRRYDVDYKFVPGGVNMLNLVASRQVNFSDFNIVPPRKIGGMIQTNDALNVEFSLRMRILED